MANWKHARRDDRLGKVRLAQQLLCEGKCRDCGEVCRVEKHDFRKASPPRCTSCGGMLDRVRGAKPKPKIPTGAPIAPADVVPAAASCGPVDAHV